MKKLLIVIISVFALQQITAQELPINVTVPELSQDPNQQFNVLNFDLPVKDRFSILYMQTIYGSVIHEGEFVTDTGSTVFRDKKFQEAVPASNVVLYIKKQSFDASGNVINSQDYFFAARPLDQQGEYKLYFPKGYKNALVSNRMLITQSIYNIASIRDFSPNELSALTAVSKPYIPVKPTDQYSAPPPPPTAGQSIAQDIKQMKSQFKSLRETGVLAKGNLPGDEKILTRNGITPDKMLVITKTKGDKSLLKFYFTQDFKIYDLIDTIPINGDIQLTSAATIYNTSNEVVGAFNNVQYKYKDEKGEEITRQYSFAMDSEYKIQRWIHSVGKDKLNSLSPEICWYEGNQLYVLSYNREKIFKTYLQVHRFDNGGEAKLLFPQTEEEKGTEKTKYVKNFQPPVPVQSTQVGPIPDQYVPINIFKAGDVRYFMMQGTKYDDAIKAKRYLNLNVYRMEASGKVTSIDILNDYNSTVPFPMQQIIKKTSGEYYLLAYPIKVQMFFVPEKSEIAPLTADNSMLLPLMDNELVRYSDYGAMMLKRSVAGSKLTVLYYPKD